MFVARGSVISRYILETSAVLLDGGNKRNILQADIPLHQTESL